MRAYLFPPAGSTSYVAAKSNISLAAIVNASLLRFVLQLLTVQVALQLTVSLSVLIPTARHNSGNKHIYIVFTAFVRIGKDLGLGAELFACKRRRHLRARVVSLVSVGGSELV